MRTNRVSALAGGVLGAVAVLLIVWLGGQAARRQGDGLSNIPEDLRTPELLFATLRLARQPLLRDPGLGPVTALAVGDHHDAPGEEAMVVGLRDVVCVSLSGQATPVGNGASSAGADRRQARPLTRLALKGLTRRVEMIDVDSDGVFEFLNRGSWACDVSLMDHEGNVVWTYGGKPGVNDACPIDVDGDGQLEVVVGFNGEGGLHLLDAHGRRIWRRDTTDVWCVGALATGTAGRHEIVHSNAVGELVVRDADGQITRKAEPGTFFTQFSVCPWPTAADGQALLRAGRDSVWVLDSDGDVLDRLAVPSCRSLGHARGAFVHLAGGDDLYFAVLIEYRNWRRTHLCVFGTELELLYQELLGEACAALAPVPLPGGDREAVLIGGNGTVWQYELPQ